MKRLIAFLSLLLPLWLPAANPNVPLYVHWDGTIAAPTQFLAAVFHAGGGIILTDNQTNLTIGVSGGVPPTSNFVVQTGTDLTNLVYLIGANDSNFVVQTATTLSNLIWAVGGNLTNFTYAIGANTTNFVITTGGNLTNLIYAVGANTTNFAYSIGANATNFAYQIGANGTNFAYSIGANATNFGYGIGANATNFGYQIGANGTNFTYAIGANCTNNDVTLSNNLYGSISGGSSNGVTVAPGTNVVVQTNGAGGVMTYTISLAAVADNWYITNITVLSNAFINNITITNVTVVSNAYIQNLFATNILIQSNCTIKGNTYISQTNFINYLVVSNLSQFGGNIEVAGTGYFNSIYVTNNSYFNGPALSFSSSASNAPAANELPTAQWVRSLFNSGYMFYSSTNVFTDATNPSSGQQMYYLTNQIPPTGSRTYVAVNAGDYIGGVCTPTNFTYLQGPISVNAYLQMTNGLGGPSVSVHPEIYYSYDRTNWLGDWSAQAQNITTGTNLYQWVISFPSTTSTNTAGFWIQRRFKVDTATGATHPNVVIHLGTNYISGTNDASHISIAGANSIASSSGVNFNELLSISNVWDGAFTNGVVDFGARKVVWNLTNGISFTNFAGLELGTGSRALVLEMWLEGCTSAAPAVLFPTMGAASYSVRIYTNDYAPVLGLVTNATKQWLLWEAHGTNITLDARVYF